MGADIELYIYACILWDMCIWCKRDEHTRIFHLELNFLFVFFCSFGCCCCILSSWTMCCCCCCCYLGCSELENKAKNWLPMYTRHIALALVSFLFSQWLARAPIQCGPFCCCLWIESCWFCLLCRTTIRQKIQPDYWADWENDSILWL